MKVLVLGGKKSVRFAYKVSLKIFFGFCFALVAMMFKCDKDLDFGFLDVYCVVFV